jgi:SAM-dependent methyltransferase
MLGWCVPDRAESIRRLSELVVKALEQATPAGSCPKELSDSIAGWSEPDPVGMAEILSRRIVQWVHSRNQFAVVEPRIRRRLQRACEQLLADGTRERSIEGPIAELARLVAPLIARSVVCADYDPELQLRVLGLEPAALAQPVLDLGCGFEARLVRWLGERGISASGIDRNLAPGAGVEADFLDHPLGVEQWGTILSHQGFSLHFIHHHLGSEELAARYAARTLEILRALRPGGAFAYAPGLPFFEPVLARAGWAVQRLELAPELAARIPPLLAERVGASVAYSAQIRRSR